MTQSTITIGYQRQSEGDIVVLATINNTDEIIDEALFEDTVLTLVSSFAEAYG